MLGFKKSLLVSGLAVVGAVSALADCGTTPVAPQLPNGAAATMEELVAASQAVKTFIADADTYLDCRLAATKTKAYKAMSQADQDAWEQEYTALTQVRNDIGPKFNDEVKAYQAANPQ